MALPLDLATIRLRLSDFVNDDSPKRWPQTTRDFYINAAYKDICTADNWPFLEAVNSTIVTAYDVGTYALPSNIQLPLGVWHTSISAENKLRAITPDERDAYQRSGQGIPAYYYRFGSTLGLYPYPNQNYTIYIEYQRSVEDLVNASDMPIFDAAFHHLIPMLAAAYLKKTSGGQELAEAQVLQADVDVGINRMRARLLPRDLDRKKSVQVSGRY